MTLDDIEVKSGSTDSDERSKGKNKGKNKTKMRAKPQQSEEEYYRTCEDRDFSDFRGRAKVILSAVAAGGQPPSDPSSNESSSDSTGGRSGRSTPRRPRSQSDESDDSVRIRVHSEHPRAAQLDRDQLRGHKAQDFIDRWSGINCLRGRLEELKITVAKSNRKIKELENYTRSSGRKQPAPERRGFDSLLWLMRPRKKAHKQWKNRSATRKSPPRCKIASMRSPPKY